MVTPQVQALDFQPALQALTLLLEESYALLRPSRPRVNIEISPGHTAGGFSVRIIEIAPPPGLLARWLGGPTDYGRTSLSAVLTSLGLIRSRGLIHLMRWLRGREPISITPQPDGSVVFELLEDGWPARQTILPGTAALYASERVRSLLLAVLNPLTWEGVTAWLIGRGGGMQTWLLRDEALPILGLPVPEVEETAGALREQRPPEAPASRPESAATESASDAQGAPLVQSLQGQDREETVARETDCKS
ncbi:hypothetical protein [Amphibiibacter pelophylacis]|uniref:Uncharacterized protein n=1 Tax=Amphibiibacter pelophylacis TaxID=1799477 RepID=A0ACC6NYV8_9BURK